MSAREHSALFERGRELLRGGHHREALACFEEASRLEPGDAASLSYRGLVLALFEGRTADGIALCRRAVDLEFYRADHYLNLARVYLKAGRKRDAVQTLKHGRTVDPRHPEITAEIAALGVRRQPVIRWLPRGHFVNRHLGRLRARLAGIWP